MEVKFRDLPIDLKCVYCGEPIPAGTIHAVYDDAFYHLACMKTATKIFVVNFDKDVDFGEILEEKKRAEKSGSN